MVDTCAVCTNEHTKYARASNMQWYFSGQLFFFLSAAQSVSKAKRRKTCFMRIVQYIISSKLNNLYKFCHFCLGLNKSVRCLFASFILIRLNFRYCELRVIFVTACRANIHQLVDVYCIVYVKWLCDCDSPSYVSLNGTAVSFACVRLGVDQKFWVGFFFLFNF